MLHFVALETSGHFARPHLLLYMLPVSSSKVILIMYVVCLLVKFVHDFWFIAFVRLHFLCWAILVLQSCAPFIILFTIIHILTASGSFSNPTLRRSDVAGRCNARRCDVANRFRVFSRPRVFCENTVAQASLFDPAP